MFASRSVASSLALLTLGLTAGCDAEPSIVDPRIDDEPSPFQESEPPPAPPTLEQIAAQRRAVQLEEEAERSSALDDPDRQDAIAAALTEGLPSQLPRFAMDGARTELAELSGLDLLERLGYGPMASVVEGDKDVFDDGNVRFRVSRTVPGYFKFADRDRLGHATPAFADGRAVSPTVVERAAERVLDTLGVPASEILDVEASPVTLDTGKRGGTVIDYGTVAYVTNVKRQIDGLAVLGSACTLAFDVRAELMWARCRWPQLTIAEAAYEPRPAEAVVSGMAKQLDHAMGVASVADFELPSDYAYAERVTPDGVEYVPVLRTIVSARDGGGAGEFLEAVDGRAL